MFDLDLLDILLGAPSRSSSMTNNYIGLHGEFDRADEDRAICEDMYGMRSQNPDTDLESHFGWENKLNYDSDGYTDEDDW